MASIGNQIDEEGDLRASVSARLHGFAESYPALRRGLLAFFRRKRATDPEFLADEVLFRVLRRLLDGDSLDEILEKYCTGVAKNVLRESRRKRNPLPLPHGLLSTDKDPLARFTERQTQALLRHSMQSIPETEATVWRRYHEEDRHRLAVELSISENALRIRVHRAGNAMIDAARKLLGATDRK